MSQSPVWILFESGNSAVVSVSLFAAPQNSLRPVDAYMLTGNEGSFTKAARRAVTSVYNILTQKNIDVKQVTAGFDLEQISFDKSFTGESGGLAFAIAFAKEIFEIDCPAVAATGEVSSSQKNGIVSSIDGIEPKLNAAINLVPKGGYLFFPAENRPEIPDSLIKIIEDKGILHYGVTTVYEALSILFPDHFSRFSNRKKVKKLLVIASLLLLISLISFFLFSLINFNKQESQETTGSQTGAYTLEKQETSIKKEDPQVIYKKHEETGFD